jgi:hypothetical protein
MGNRIDYIKGDKVGNCTFIKDIESIVIPKKTPQGRIRRRRQALFICSCGKEFTGLLDKVRVHKLSCGCLHRNKMEKLRIKAVRHGKYHHPLYSVWEGMIHRCEDPLDENYYGRGIRVCDRWQDINNFIVDMYPSYIKGLEIDRIDNDGGYSPENCRWVTRRDNCNNRRNTIFITYLGEKKTLADWSILQNIPSQTLLNRTKRWGIEEAFSTPYPSNKRYKRYERLVR